MLRRRKPLKQGSTKTARRPRADPPDEGYVPRGIGDPGTWAVRVESAAGEVWQALDELIYLHTHGLSAGLRHDQNRIRFQRAVAALVRNIQA